MKKFDSEETAWIVYMAREYLEEQSNYHPDSQYQYGRKMCNKVLEKCRVK